MAGITPQGFVPKTLREIREDLIVDLKIIKDPVTGEFPLFDLDDDTVLSQTVGVFSAALSEAWQQIAEVYLQFDPQTNTGVGQSATVQLNAITRKSGTRTKLYLTLGGMSGAVVPKGSAVSDMAGTVQYATDLDVLFTGPDNTQVTEDVTATASLVGDNSPGLGTVIKILTPVSGWLSCTNTGIAVTGTAEETDATLRKRQQRSTALTSYRQIEAIWSALINIDGVSYCRVYQHDSKNPVDDRGIPFKEVAAIVEGGKDAELAAALFFRLPTGQIGYGATSVVQYDRQGFAYPISFSRPAKVLIYIKMLLYIYDSADWPTDGPERIRQEIIDYARYNTESSEDVGFPPGTDVIRTRLYTPINTVPGSSVKKLELSRNGVDYAEVDIDILWNELAVFLASNIVIDLTSTP